MLMTTETLDGDDHAAMRALNVVVQAETVLVFISGGGTLSMSAEDAELSAKRLLDAADIARGRLPGSRG